MIFGFLKNKTKDKTIDYHNDWLKVSIFDRFLRFVGVLLIIGLGIVLLTGGIDFSGGSISIASWLLPLVIIFLIFDLLFFRIIIPSVWSIITEIVSVLYDFIKDLFFILLDMVKEIGWFILMIPVEIFKALFGDLFGKK